MSEIRTCKKCGFILDTKPGLKEIDGVCLACINAEKKKTINFKERQEWLTKYIKENRTNKEYDCVVGVSGGKDSHMIVERLIKNHGVKNPLLVTVCDEFTATHAGLDNRNNISEHFNLDHLLFRCNPKTFKEETKKDFENALFPLKWIERRLYEIPFNVAKNYGIKLVFFGENSDFDYGMSTELEIFHPLSTDETQIIYMGAIYPYSTVDSLDVARKCGFKDLDYYNEWQRNGNIENYTQIDSIGYIIHLWCKFVKFGYQRVTDMACRHVREGLLTKEQAELLIKEKDYIIDSAAMRDFCRCIGISEKHFFETVDKFVNKDLIVKDINGNYRRKDLYDGPVIEIGRTGELSNAK